MSREFFSYDPFTGVTQYFDYDEDRGEAIITKTQDVEAILRKTADIRNTCASDKKLKNDDYMCLYAVIPPVVEVQMMKKGLFLDNPDHGPGIMKEIEQNYKYLKVTDKKHDR